MALIVEDGSGLPDAESYISVADSDTYFTNRGNTAWTGTDTVKENALRRATDYMEQVYRDLWQGGRVSAAQALSWPRYGVVVDGFDVPEDLVPVEVRRACAELAVRALTEDLLADVDSTTTQVIREKLGEMEVQYSDSTQSSGVVEYKAVDAMLEPLLEVSRSGVKSIEVMRA